MGTLSDVRAEVASVFATKWQKREGQVVPEPESVQLGNDAVKLNGTVLYADLAQSSELVKGYKDHFAAEVYKAYLVTACRIIRSDGGEITAFDGDRVMAVYLGNSKNSDAARSALKINWAVKNIINPAIQHQYPNTAYAVSQVVGIDTGPLLVAKTGIRGSNDLVWVGRAANYAAKLCDIRKDTYSSWITADVFNNMNAEVKKSTKGEDMWAPHEWDVK